MYDHILCPLDGSSLAEDVLGVVESLCSHFDARVTLLHVLELNAPEHVHGDTHLRDSLDASAYLERVAGRLRSSGAEVTTHVHERSVGDVSAAIDTHAHEYGADLIAMCKHGRSGLRARFVGSIAQRILRGGGTPILLRTPREPEREEGFELKEVLVPLDFEHDTEAVLEVARTIARPYGARLNLMTAVSTAGSRREGPLARLLPGATAASLEMVREDMTERLEEQVAQLAAKDADARFSLRDEEPSNAILAEAGEIAADLVVLATHARSGFEAWYEGSTGESVMTGGAQTLLLLREL